MAFGPNVSSVVITMLGETARPPQSPSAACLRSCAVIAFEPVLPHWRLPPPRGFGLAEVQVHLPPPLARSTQGIATVVKLLLCVNLMLTFPIVCRSAFLIIEGAPGPRGSGRVVPLEAKSGP